MPGDASHIQRVGDDETIEAEFIAEQAADNSRRERRRSATFGLERRHGEVPGHDRACSGGKGRAKRRQFHRVEMGAVARDGGQVEMRVDLSIAVAGEMFGRGKRAVFFNAADVCFDERRNPLRIFAERAHVDDGVVGVAVYVRDGRENPVHANGPRFGRGNASDRVGVLGTAGRSNGHGMRKRRAILEAHGGAAFEIRRKEQGDARCFLQEINERGGLVWLTAFDSEGAGTRAQHESTDVVVLNRAQQLTIFRAIEGREFAMERQHDELPKLFLQAHFCERALDPGLGRA